MFASPETRTAAERYSWLVVHPRDTVPETDIDTPITFEISGRPTFLDPRNNLLKIKFKVTKDNVY